jgi:hypothetical protein
MMQTEVEKTMRQFELVSKWRSRAFVLMLLVVAIPTILAAPQEKKVPVASGVAGWHYAGGIADYPQDGNIGGPNRAFVIRTCERTEHILSDLSASLMAISCADRPPYKEIKKGPPAVQWALHTASLHAKIFHTLDAQKDILALYVMLADRESVKHPTEEALGCVLKYRNDVPGMRILGFDSSWPSYDVAGFLNAADRSKYGIGITPIYGSRGGTLDILIRLQLGCASRSAYEVGGLTRTIFSFNPFRPHTVAITLKGMEPALTFSQDFDAVELLGKGKSTPMTPPANE